MMQYRVVWLFIFLILNIMPTIAQDNLSVEVIGVPVYNQDNSTVSVDVVVMGERSLELTNLTPVNFEIGEPLSNLSVTPQRRLPIALAVIVDMSFGSDADLIRDTLRSFFINYYQADDEVTLYILDGASNIPRIVEIDSLETATGVIDGLQQQEPFYFITDAVDRALNDLIVKGNSPVRPRMALHVGSLIARPSETSASVAFARENIPYFVVQTHRLRDQQAPLFRELANNGAGIFSNNKNGTFVLAEADFQAVNTLKLLFDTIDNTRLVYQLSYTSRNQSLSEIREVPLTVRLNSQFTATTDFSYSRSFNPPQIEFANPADLIVNRVPFRDENAQITYSRNTQSVTINPIYPDGVNRNIDSMRLEVFEVGTQNILQSTLTSNLTPNIDGQYVLTWSLDDFSVPDTVTEVQVRVTAFDVLGLTAITERPATVSVASAPPLPTPTPTAVPTEAPTEVVEADATPILAPPSSAQAGVGTSTGVASAAANDSATLFIFAIIVLLIIIIILLVRVWRFSRDGRTLGAGGPVDREDIVPNNLDDMPTPSPEELDMMDEDVAIAQLIVTKGFDTSIFAERVIKITTPEFLIGRAEDDETDLVVNVPYVSPHHCVILVEEGNQFMVRDLGSKNGTFVNDERVKDDDSMPAPLGSEISITKSITMEIWDANIQLDMTRFDRDGDGDDDAMDEVEEAEFQPLPGLKYVDDDGDPIDPNYEPI